MTDTIQFRILQEVKDKKTGKSVWQRTGNVTPICAIEDVSVTTKANYQTIGHSTEPKIIPFGVAGEGGRVATVTGVFFGRSLNYDATSDAYLEVCYEGAEEQMLGYGVTLATPGAYKLLPELGTNGTCKWRIESFQWDRAAIKRGQWKFTMTLGYIWDPELNELKLYEDGVGTNLPDNVKFSAVKGFAKSSYLAGIQILNPNIFVTVHDLNRATFTTPTQEFNKGDIIHIYCQTRPTSAVFFGYVEETIKDSYYGVKYTCSEIGKLLERVPCAKIGSGVFKPKVMIRNPSDTFGGYLTIDNIVQTIMEFYDANAITGFNPGYGIDTSSNNSLMNSTTYPGTDTKFDSQMLSGNNIYSALKNFLVDQCKLYMWFDNDDGKLAYGYVRNASGINIDPANEYIMNSAAEETHDDEYQADWVALCDSTGANVAVSGIGGTGTYIYYKIDTTVGNLQLKEMANKIYSDMDVDRDTFKVTFPPGVVRFRDGDVFVYLGDATVDPPMICRGPYDDDPTTNPGDSVWQIKEMTIKDTYTECVVGSSYYSIFDIYRSSLKRVASFPVDKATKSVQTNQRVVTTE